MSNLPGNPHHDVADSLKREYCLTNDKEALNWPLAEINERLAALAYEQRTVAMVHWATHLARTSRPDEELETEITERLGMRAEK